MHELYIAEAILKSANRSLPSGITGSAVQKIRIRAGQLDAVVPDSLVFLFDAIKGNFGMPNSQLEIEEVAVVCRCIDCDNRFDLEIPLFLCPRCGSGKVEVLQGRGIELQSIFVQDAVDCGV
jgi:hydrogenase nickel incorporation protein HypA/HybF